MIYGIFDICDIYLLQVGLLPPSPPGGSGINVSI